MLFLEQLREPLDTVPVRAPLTASPRPLARIVKVFGRGLHLEGIV